MSRWLAAILLAVARRRLVEAVAAQPFSSLWVPRAGVLDRNFFFPRLFVFLAGLFVVAAVGFFFAFFLVNANVLSRNTNDCLDHS